MDIFKHLEQQNILLTPQQRRAVTAEENAVLLLAVPGAGKTTTLAARVAWLMSQGSCAPEQLLNLTFNREAAWDMQRRFTQLFGSLWPAEEQPGFSTIHSFCYRLLRDYAADRGTKMPRLLAEGQQRSLVLDIYLEKAGDYLSEEGLDQLLNAIGLCANMMYTEEECRRLEREVHGLYQVRTAYREYKLTHRLMDFDDMLDYALQVLRRQPSRTALLRQRHPWLHLDEAQDTSLLQHTIIDTLVPGHLFFVGDEDQSIYGFRGAFPEALLRFEERYPGGVVLKMEENFRSGQNIVDAADLFIAQNSRRYAKTMRSAAPERGEVKLLEAGEIDRQYQKVAEALAKLPPHKTAAVLYRGGLSAAAMADALLRRNIPFALRAKRYPILQDGVVRDVLSLLRLALDPGDSKAFLQIYYKLGCYVKKETAQRVAEAQPTDLWEYLIEEEDFPGKSTARLSFLRSFFRRMRRWTPEQALERMVYELEYLDQVEKRGESGYAVEAVAQRLAVLRSIARGCSDIGDFARHLAELDRIIDRETDPQAVVTLSTVHSAKGREFDLVWLIDLVEGVFPAGSAVEENLVGNSAQLEEEARMFYVASTRARSCLTLCAADSFCGYEMLPSRFVGRLMGADGLPENSRDLLELGLRRGVRLSHKIFGYGTVEEINMARGMFSVRFAKLGLKTFSFDSLRGDIFRVL